jgi:hypothetical protein
MNSRISRAMLNIITIPRELARSRSRILITMNKLMKTGIWKTVEVSTRKIDRVLDV